MEEKKVLKGKLLDIQQELKAPKGQFNSFGGYKYRSCEDILEAVKPICNTHKALLTLSDDIINVGDRYYIKATARIRNVETDEEIHCSALAREALTKKGMDDSQISGTASSYARKYALNGLFCIDDTKDADTDEYTKRTAENPKQAVNYVCADCGKPFEAFKNYTAKQIYDGAVKANADGKARCKECRLKKEAEVKNEQ